MQPLQYIFSSSEKLRPPLHFEISGFWNAGFVRCRQIGGGPRIESSIQHVDVRMAEEFQEPEKACGTHSGDVVIDDNGAVGIHTVRLDEVFDDPEECLQRLWACIDQADAEDIEASRPRYVTCLLYTSDA